MMTLQPHTGRYSGHPVACAVGLKIQDFIESGFFVQAAWFGDGHYKLASHRSGVDGLGKAAHAGSGLALEPVAGRALCANDYSDYSVIDINLTKLLHAPLQPPNQLGAFVPARHDRRQSSHQPSGCRY